MEQLKSVIQEVIKTGTRVSNAHYIGLGIYKGEKNGEFVIKSEQMALICNALGLEPPVVGVWYSDD